jgi:hypothetical protein
MIHQFKILIHFNAIKSNPVPTGIFLPSKVFLECSQYIKFFFILIENALFLCHYERQFYYFYFLVQNLPAKIFCLQDLPD